MDDSNYIQIYENVLSQDKCDHYINLIEKSYKNPGMIFSDTGKIITDKNVKISEDINISSKYPKEIDFLMSLFSTAITRYENDINCSIPIQQAEQFLGRVYRKGEGFYKEHIDNGGINTSLRCVSMLLYLNTVLEGGQLNFPRQNKLIDIKQGRLVIFPSNWMYVHAAYIPISNDRYIIRTFMTYE